MPLGIVAAAGELGMRAMCGEQHVPAPSVCDGAEDARWPVAGGY